MESEVNCGGVYFFEKNNSYVEEIGLARRTKRSLKYDANYGAIAKRIRNNDLVYAQEHMDAHRLGFHG